MSALDFVLQDSGIRGALADCEDEINAILADDEAVWGPRWVEVHMRIWGCENLFLYTFGRREQWKEEWGAPKDFMQIAAAKSHLALRSGFNTSLAVASNPLVLRQGDYLYPGGVVKDGLAVGVSGVKGETDERIAWIILLAIERRARAKVLEMVEAGQHEI